MNTTTSTTSRNASRLDAPSRTGTLGRQLATIAAVTSLAAALLLTVGCNRGAEEPVVPEAEASSEAAEGAAAEQPVEAAGANGDDHAGHDHAGHDHAGHDHAGHDHAGHDHGQAAGSAERAPTGGMEDVLREGEYDPAELVAQPGAAVGQVTRCPVSGEAFRVSELHAHVDHEGSPVYFCCPSCIRRFQRDPAQYLGAR